MIVFFLLKRRAFTHAIYTTLVLFFLRANANSIPFHSAEEFCSPDLPRFEREKVIIQVPKNQNKLKAKKIVVQVSFFSFLKSFSFSSFKSKKMSSISFSKYEID